MANWEICQIKLGMAANPKKRLTFIEFYCHYEFYAQMAGSGRLIVASPPFEMVAQGDPGNDERATETLNILRALLMSDGWEKISAGPNWYNDTFRRIKRESSTYSLRFPSVPRWYLSIKSLSFFEKAFNSETCSYGTHFPKSIARYIGYDLRLKNIADHDRTYREEYRYYYPDGDLMSHSQMDWLIKAGRNASSTQSWGWSEPGRWGVGTYRVEIFLDGTKFAEGSFKVI